MWFQAKTQKCVVLVCCHGRRKGGGKTLDFEIQWFPIYFFKEKCFSICFEWVKLNFTMVGSPLEICFWSPPGKIHHCPPWKQSFRTHVCCQNAEQQLPSSTCLIFWPPKAAKSFPAPRQFERTTISLPLAKQRHWNFENHFYFFGDPMFTQSLIHFSTTA